MIRVGWDLSIGECKENLKLEEEVRQQKARDVIIITGTRWVGASAKTTGWLIMVTITRK